jgi:hypothetical protein
MTRDRSQPFGAAASAYAEHRPDYAPDAVRWAVEPAPGPRVLDLGAGTGKLTGTLAELGLDVVALRRLRRTSRARVRPSAPSSRTGSGVPTTRWSPRSRPEPGCW